MKCVLNMLVVVVVVVLIGSKPYRLYVMYILLCACLNGRANNAPQSSSKKATLALVEPDLSLFSVEYFVSPLRICSALIISKAH